MVDKAYVFNLSVHTSIVYTPYKGFFGQKVRIHLNILFRAALRDKSKMLSIAEFKELLTDM